jgi:predicted NBD/HSP70 family sugar kinase
MPQFLDRCRKEGIKIDHEQDMPDIVAQGKQEFNELLRECATAVGFAIAAVINTLAPDAVIVSSPYATCGAAFQEPLTNALSKFTQADLLTQCKILQSQLKGSPEAYGAALSAMQSYPLLEHVSARL